MVLPNCTFVSIKTTIDDLFFMVTRKHRIFVQCCLVNCAVVLWQQNTAIKQITLLTVNLLLHPDQIQCAVKSTTFTLPSVGVYRLVTPRQKCHCNCNVF